MMWLATKALIVIIICTLVWIVIEFAFPIHPVVVATLGLIIISGAVIMWGEFKNSI